MCQCNKFWFCCVFLTTITLINIPYVTAFNVDSFNYAIYGGADSSMFGFSIAVHKEGNTGWLIVGAPEAQSTYQQRVRRGGVVYKCTTYQDDNCQEIPFDPKDDNYDTDGNRMDNKTEQWFGATVSTSGRVDGPIVACAPRYTWFPRSRRRDPVGTCYVSDEHFSNFNEYAPCRTYHWGYHRQGSCQAGFSAAINHQGDRLFIGAPGSWYWQGQIYSVDAHATFEYKPLIFSATYGSAGQVHQQSLETRPAVFSTTEGREKDDDSYMGYSMITGDFLGNGEDSIAVGMPRGNDLRGKVLLFTWNLTNFLHHFTSDQLGCYFGYAMAGSDVDGDGFVDLIVGAPMYTVQNNEGKYDVGRVYVIYHQSQKGKFVATFEIDGFNSKSRFGQALAALGDINQDGYGDFAVGAPYDGPNERGAVYIYHGSNKGIRKTYSQVIYAEDIIKGPLNVLTTFGFSITGGLDLDGNGYPDMAVGAYLSNKAFFFRSRPVVAVDAAVEFLAYQKEVDIKQPDYILRNGARAVRTQIEYCLKYHGKGIPDYIDLSLQYILDSKKPKSPRMGFVDNENVNILNDTVRIYKGQNVTCLKKDVFVKSDIRDKLTPLVGEMRYWMQDDLQTIYYNEARNPRSLLKPILDLNSPPSRKDSLNIHMECGDDKICHPNLNLNVTPNFDEYLLDTKEPLIFDVIVTNFGEDAFESTLEVKYPDNVYYSKIEDVKVESPVLCNTYENNTLKCEIGNPIPKEKVVRFKIRWQPDYKEGMLPFYTFILNVSSTNQEKSHARADNTVTKNIKVRSDFHLEISGKSQPGEVYVNQSLYEVDISNQNTNTPFEDRLGEEVIGPQVTHIYYLRNNGPTAIRETELYFMWPSATLANEDLLYLLDGPHFSPGTEVECDMIPANYRGFNYIRDDRSIWKRLQIKVNKDEDHIVTGARVSATIGGKSVKGDENLNKAVGESGDSSDVFQHRKQGGIEDNARPVPPTAGSGRVNGFFQQTNRTTFTNSSGSFLIYQDGRVVKIDQSNNQNNGELASTHGAFKCYDLVNNQLQIVPCQSGTTYRVYRQVGSQQEMRLIGQCFNTNYNGDRVPTDCNPEIRSGNLIFTYDQPFTITNIQQTFNTYEKCYDIMDGERIEVDCGPGLRMHNTTFRCFDQINGQLIEVQCESGYTYRYHQPSGAFTNLIRGCYQLDNGGIKQNIECGPEFYRRNILYRFQQQTIETGGSSTGFQFSNNTFACYETINGDVRGVPCQIGTVYKYYRVGLSGYELCLGCFNEVYSRRQEMPCSANWRRQDIVFQGASTVVRTAGSSGGAGGSSQEVTVNLKQRCYDLINGVRQEVECSAAHNETGSVSLHSRCYDIVDGRRIEVPCVPGASLDFTQSFTNKGVINIGGDMVHFKCYDRDNREVTCSTDDFRAGRITYKCFKEIKGGLRPIACSPAAVFQGIAQQTSGTYQASGSSGQNYRTAQQGGNFHYSSGGSDGAVHQSGSSGQQSGAAHHSSGVSGDNVHQSGASGTFHHSSSSSGSGDYGGTIHHTGASGQQSGGVHHSSGGTVSQSANAGQNYGTGHYSSQSGSNLNAHQSGHDSQYYGGGSASYEYNYDDNAEEEEEEEEDEKAITSYYNPNANTGSPGSVSNTGIRQGAPTRGRNPQTYGKNGVGEVLGKNSLGNAALNRNFTTTFVDLSDVGGGYGKNRSQNAQGTYSGSSYEQHWSQTHPIAPVYDNFADRDNVPTDRPSGNTRYYGRKKRGAPNRKVLDMIMARFPCNSVHCTYMTCRVGLLRANDEVTIAIRSRFNARILENVTTSQPIRLSSVMAARVSKLPYVSTTEEKDFTYHEVHTTIPVTVAEYKPDFVPLWVVVLSAVAGTIILLLLIFLLYKLGFFKRNRPSSAPERQPLNRNGYHDEAL